MRRIAAAFLLAAAVAGPARATPAVTNASTLMREAPDSHARVVQSIPASAEIDLVGCGKAWCSASRRDIDGFVRASVVSEAPPGPPLAYQDAPPPPPPLVVAPFGWSWGYGYGWGHPWRHYYY